MPVIHLRPSAKADIAGIWDYVAEDSEAAANRVLEQIDAQFSVLARYPLVGRSRPGLYAGLRSFPVGSYLIYYLPLTSGIDVLRVRHGSRDTQMDAFEDVG